MCGARQHNEAKCSDETNYVEEQYTFSLTSFFFWMPAVIWAAGVAGPERYS
jgi:hypothetical protein